MSDDTRLAAEVRFAREMRRIRELRDVSVEDVHEQTRIAPSVIEDFEEGELYDHPTFNEVYLRSFVRAYAEAIDISPEEALSALDTVLTGTYDGSLAASYLDDDVPPVGPSEKESSPASGDQEERNEPSQHLRSQGQAERAELDPSTADAESSSDGADGVEPVGEREKAPTDRMSERLDVGNLPPLVRAVPADPAEIIAALRNYGQEEEIRFKRPDEPLSWSGRPGGRSTSVSVSDDRGEQREEEAFAKTGGRGPPERTSSFRSEPADGTRGVSGPGRLIEILGSLTGWVATPYRNQAKIGVAAGLILLVFGLGVWLLMMDSSDSPQTNSTESAPVDDDTTVTASVIDTDTASTEEQSAAAPDAPEPTAEDTLYLTVQADSTLQPLRVQRDEDLRRPYWLEQGDLATFPFSSRVIVEEEWENVSLFLDRYPYPVASDTQSSVQIDRDRVQAFFDSVDASRVNWSTMPDTIPIGAPPAQE